MDFGRWIHLVQVETSFFEIDVFHLFLNWASHSVWSKKIASFTPVINDEFENDTIWHISKLPSTLRWERSFCDDAIRNVLDYSCNSINFSSMTVCRLMVCLQNTGTQFHRPGSRRPRVTAISQHLCYVYVSVQSLRDYCLSWNLKFKFLDEKLTLMH